MLNELFFLLQIITVIIFVLASLYLGSQALVSFVCVQVVLANLFVTKQITLFGLNATCSDVFIVGSILGINLVQEYFSENLAKKTIYISFFISIFYLIMSQIHVFYIPNSYDYMQEHFVKILNFMPRITIASIIAYFVIQVLNLSFYKFLKKVFLDKYLVTRNFISIVVVQLLDTLIFASIGLCGIVNSILPIILISFTIKLIVILISTPFINLVKIIKIK
ncbi:queuosine precursor transporter [Candidatus Babeliales bacterium]|nr:queuosine precursor transporter [Candidatus Babeliales bacterium]MCF7899405.1 queuosine precursor transporter [Candidatus Babeliales bacterium]